MGQLLQFPVFTIASLRYSKIELNVILAAHPGSSKFMFCKTNKQIPARVCACVPFLASDICMTKARDLHL
jgi:hypothetical protein